MGLALAQGMNSAAQGDATAERWGLEGQTTYQRVRLNSFVKTDPFNGEAANEFGRAVDTCTRAAAGEAMIRLASSMAWHDGRTEHCWCMACPADQP